MEKFVVYLAKDGSLTLKPDDEIVKGALVVKDGDVVHAAVKEAMSKPGGA
jgi:hypothetical protein